jgi:putative flavoprotein involved in K+ transport
LSKNIDVLVIGAGQAGLAMGYYLKQTKRSFVLVDASNRIGDVWRNRYESLVLFSPRKYSSLPGMEMIGNPDDFPTKDEFAEYLDTYSKKFAIPVELNTIVQKLEQLEGRYRVATSQGEYIAKNVVIATGPFQKPFIPKLSGMLPENIYQIHSSEYREPSQLPEGSVLVVGGGNSGVQIATELSKDREVFLSAGHEIIFLPHRFLSRSILWWLNFLRLSKVSVDSRLAKFLMKTEPVIGMELRLLIESGKVKIKERAISIDGQEIKFKDGSKLRVNNLIWATGFQFDYSWIDITGVLDQQKRPIHHRGISPVKGLYFLGLRWLSRQSSALIHGVGYDAKKLTKYLD